MLKDHTSPSEQLLACELVCIRLGPLPLVSDRLSLTENPMNLYTLSVSRKFQFAEKYPPQGVSHPWASPSAQSPRSQGITKQATKASLHADLDNSLCSYRTRYKMKTFQGSKTAASDVLNLQRQNCPSSTRLPTQTVGFLSLPEHRGHRESIRSFSRNLPDHRYACLASASISA